jgi:hypothetical protein
MNRHSCVYLKLYSSYVNNYIYQTIFLTISSHTMAMGRSTPSLAFSGWDSYLCDGRAPSGLDQSTRSREIQDPAAGLQARQSPVEAIHSQRPCQGLHWLLRCAQRNRWYMSCLPWLQVWSQCSVMDTTLLYAQLFCCYECHVLWNLWTPSYCHTLGWIYAL